MIIYNAKDLAKRVEDMVAKEVELLPRNPTLVILQANNDPSSELYVYNKIKACNRVGIKVRLHRYDETVTFTEMIDTIERSNNDTLVDGILVQMPLYPHLEDFSENIVQAIAPSKDVDCFTHYNIGKMMLGEGHIKPLTAKGVLGIIKDIGVSIEGKHVVVLGRSMLSGRSIAELLLQENATVTICHSRSKSLKIHTLNADIIVSCMGKGDMIDSSYIKSGAVLINVGMSKCADGKIHGDFDFDEIIKSNKPSFITKTFNTTGLMTVTNLLESILQMTKCNLKK